MIAAHKILIILAFIQMMLPLPASQAATSGNDSAKAIYSRLKRVEKKLDRIQKMHKSTADRLANSGKATSSGVKVIFLILIILTGISLFKSWQNSKALEFLYQHSTSTMLSEHPNRQFQLQNLSGLNRPPVSLREEHPEGILTHLQNRMNELEATAGRQAAGVQKPTERRQIAHYR